jgi:hypothetical protein
MRVGVVVEQRRLDNPWQAWSWHAVSVIPGAPPIEAPRLLRSGEGWWQRHAATLDIEIFERETDGYLHNLSQAAPVVYVVMRREEESAEPVLAPLHVTVCPYEAQEYLETGDDTVDPVPMPEVVVAWLQDFVRRYHVDVPFVKRKQKNYDARRREGFVPPPDRVRRGRG